MNSPLEVYDAEVAAGRLDPDEEQRAVMTELDRISRNLQRESAWKPPSKSLFARWRKTTDESMQGVTGLYLWGGVGRGKTHLCDLFFENAGVANKRRLHFHHFMQQIHAGLRERQQMENPLESIARAWADEARLLLLDEIHVNDITDAMLLGGLLTALFRRGVTLVTTSNRKPSDLYKEGLQRARFLPAIAQIEAHTKVIEMLGETDYRLRLLEVEPIHLVSDPACDGGLGVDACRAAMHEHFLRLSAGNEPEPGNIEVNGRVIDILGRAGDFVWFDFQSLCATARSTDDYIEIARRFHTVMLSDIPVMNENRNDEARRFVNMIDEFYERNVCFLMSSEAPADELYRGQRMAFEFERAASRLFEMRTHEYLAGHRRRHGDDPA